MRKLIFASLLLASLPLTAWAGPEHQKDRIIGSLYSRQTRSQESFDVEVASIRAELEKTPKIGQEKLDMLSDWVARLLAGQKIIQKRLEDLTKDPDAAVLRRGQAANLAKLYKERVDVLEDLIIAISNY